MNDYHARQKGVISKETGDRIKTSKILVIGAGAGGNEVLKNLALMGFGNFTIVDFDPIEDSNLSRTTLFSKEDIGKPKAEIAAKTLSQVSLHEKPNILGINAKIQDIGKQIFLNNDIIICCVDTMNARAYINDWCVRLKKPLFELGFDKFMVQVSFFPNEKQTDACLREVIGYGDFSGARNSCSKLKVIDSELAHIPTIQVAAALAGALLATEVVMFLQGTSKLKNKLLQYAADYHRILKIDYPQSNKCVLHKHNDYKIFKSKLNPKENSFNDLLIEMKKEFNSDFYINWYEEYIYSMECENCRKEILIKKFKSDIYDNERWCPQCQDHYSLSRGVTAKWLINKELYLNENSDIKFFLDLPMVDYGIKKDDIVIVSNQSNSNMIMVLI